MFWFALPALAQMWQPSVPAGPLTGLTVYVSAGHGKLMHRKNHDGEPVGWGYQRTRHNGVLEDKWTADFVAFDLAPALEEAGAQVITLRERDRNRIRVIADDMDEEHFSASDILAWGADPMAHLEHDTVISGEGMARWTLQVPETGHWTVYTQWTARDNQDAEAVYMVSGGGLTQTVRVDQRHHGGHWMKLMDGCWEADTELEILLMGSGSAPVSADAVRIGGGEAPMVMPVKPYFTMHPVWDLAMAHQAEYLGIPEDVLTYACGAPKSDMRLRAHWVSWAHPQGEDAVFLSVHTNGGGGRGSLVFASVKGGRTRAAPPQSMVIARTIERSMRSRLRKKWPSYTSQGAIRGDYSEISPDHNTVPGALIEVGFHDNAIDARMLRNPAFRTDVATAVVDGLIEYQNQK